MAKDRKITPMDVEVDHLGLSVLGWEIPDVQARLIIRTFADRSEWYEVAASAEVRFHPDDWQVRFNVSNFGESEYLAPIVWQLRSRVQGAVMAYAQMTSSLKIQEVRAPKMISASMESWEGDRRVDPEDLYIWIGGVDWDKLGHRSEPSFQWRDVKCEILDYTTSRGIATEVKEYSARVRDDEELEVGMRAIHSVGSAEELFTAAVASDEYWVDPGTSLKDQTDDIVVQAPDIAVDVFDESGFLLDNRDFENHRWVTLGGGGVVPKRNPSFLLDASFRVNKLAGDPARVVIRIQDPVQ